MASKVQVAKFPLRDFNDPTFSVVWNMEEDDVAGQLTDDSFKKRVEVLEQLIITVKRNGGRLPYTDGESIFRSLGLALSDSNWEIRNKCIQLLQEIIPNLGDDIDTCMSLVLNKMLANIGDSKVTVRRMVVQALHAYMKHTHNLSALFDAIVNTGLENESPSVRREMVTALPLLLTRDFVTQDLSKIITSLAKKLLDTSAEDNLKDSSLSTLNKIETMVGDRVFAAYLKNLSLPLQKYYMQLSGKHEASYYNDTDGEYYNSMHQSGMMNGRNDSRREYQTEESFEFGVVPSQILNRINEQKDFRTRAQAVEDLKSIIVNTSTHEVSTSMMRHMNAFINFLSNLLDDPNFKIINVTLEIMLSLVEKLDKSTKNYLAPLTSALLKRMGDNKIVIRQIVMGIVMKLMRCASPQAVINVLEENLQHRNSRVRQETINFIIAALLTFPRYEFDIPAICKAVGPTLTDVKRAVRQAALECFATLAQVMGSGQLQPLVSAVDQVELSTDGEGLMAAVQARLARKQLPKLTSDGLVEYTTQTPSSATVRSSTAQHDADTEWILAVGSGMSSTARTARSEFLELESVTTSARSTPMVGSDVSAPTPAPRRFMSAGRGRNKLPWEEEKDERTGPYSGLPNSAPNQSYTQEDAPPRPRQMWMGDGDQSAHYGYQQQQQLQQQPSRQPPKRRTTVMALTPPEDPDNAGSYAQMYQQKLRRQQGATPRGMQPHDLKENGFNRQDQRTPRTFLDPISVDADDASSTVSNTFRADEDESPVPRRPAIARGSATRRKVPPISPSSDYYDDNDSAYAPSEEGRTGMNGSLRTIRNSATKKRAEKLFEKLSDKSGPGSTQGSDQLEESGIFSASSQHNTVSETNSRKSSVTKKPEAKLVHANSNNNMRSNNATTNLREESDGGSYSQIHSRVSVGGGPGNTGMIHLDYNPTSGVTFRENRNSDVQVVGKGYGDDASSSVSAPAGPTSTSRVKDRRRFNSRGSLVSSAMGMASIHLPGSVDSDSDEKISPPHDTGFSLRGRGMFEAPTATADFGPGFVGGQSQDGRLDRRKMDIKTGPAGVVGIAMRSNNDFLHSESGGGADDEQEHENNMAIPQSLKEKVAVKQQQRQEEDERRKAEKERKEREKEEKREREKEEKMKRERERQQEKLKRLSSAESINSLEFLSISGSGSGSSINSTSVANNSSSNNINSINTSNGYSNNNNNTYNKPANYPPKPQPPAVTPRKTLKTSNEPVSTHPMPVSSSSTPMDAEDPSEWTPFKDGDAAFRDMMKKMEQGDWEIKCEGINMLRRLCMHHPDVVAASLHPIVLAICNEAKNLRSQVSRLGITAIGDMFGNLKKGMDPEVDITTKTLLTKSGESNQFIKEDVDKALCQMVDNVTPQRALLALIGGGATHKNVFIRKLTAQFLVDLVERMGSGRILSGVKDITDRVLPTAAQFAMDGSQETRYYGRKILYMLMSHQDFDKMLTKYLPNNTLRNIQDIVDNLKQKGLGERPSELSSARSRRSGQGSRSNSSIRGGSASSSADSGFQQPKRRALMRTDEARMGEVKAMTDLMSANNWQERYEGLNSFLSMCETNSSLVSSQIIKIFDKFLPRLLDSNSKVNLFALRVMLQITPILRDSMSSVISMTVGNVAPNLSSKNKEIYTTAAEILEAFIENLELTMLVQPFANQAINATSRSKADMVLRVAYLVEKVYPRKQRPIVLHVLPLLWHLLGTMNSSGGAALHGAGGGVDLRQATLTLVRKLHDCMGPGLMEKANAEPGNTQRQIQLLQSLTEDM